MVCFGSRSDAKCYVGLDVATGDLRQVCEHSWVYDGWGGNTHDMLVSDRCQQACPRCFNGRSDAKCYVELYVATGDLVDV